MDIPAIIKNKARELGFNSIELAKIIKGKSYYSIGVVDENGDALPTGLPTFLVLSDNQIEVVSGNEGLELCSRLY